MNVTSIATKGPDNICAAKDCGGPGDWRLIYIVPPPKETHPRPREVAATVATTLIVCSPHLKDITIEDIMSDEAFQVLSDTMAAQGKVRPLREDIVLDAVHRTDPKFDELDPERIQKQQAVRGSEVLTIATQAADYERERMLKIAEEWWHSGKANRTLDHLLVLMRTTPRV